MSTRHSRGSNQGYRVIHQPVSHGLAVFADAWLALASGDQRRFTGSGSAFEVFRDVALYKSTYFTLLVTLPRVAALPTMQGPWRSLNSLTTDFFVIHSFVHS